VKAKLRIIKAMHKESIEFNSMITVPYESTHHEHLEVGQYAEEEDPIEQELRAVQRSGYWLLRFPEHLEASY
jgi:hypothetical protein